MVEHAIGRLKARFPILRALPFRLKTEGDFKRSIETFEVCVVLHNILHHDRIPNEWIDHGDAGGAPHDHREDAADIGGNPNVAPVFCNDLRDETRREQLFQTLFGRAV